MDDFLAQVIGWRVSADTDDGGLSELGLEDRPNESTVVFAKSTENILGENPGWPVKQESSKANPDLLIVTQLAPPLGVPIE